MEPAVFGKVTNKVYQISTGFQLVGEGGFEPPKSLTTDLQSAPFGRSGTLPYSLVIPVEGKVEPVNGLEPLTC